MISIRSRFFFVLSWENVMVLKFHAIVMEEQRFLSLDQMCQAGFMSQLFIFMKWLHSESSLNNVGV